MVGNYKAHLKERTELNIHGPLFQETKPSHHPDGPKPRAQPAPSIDLGAERALYDFSAKTDDLSPDEFLGSLLQKLINLKHEAPSTTVDTLKKNLSSEMFSHRTGINNDAFYAHLYLFMDSIPGSGLESWLAYTLYKAAQNYFIAHKWDAEIIYSNIPLTYLPLEIEKCRDLIKLDLSNTQLSSVPLCLTKLKKLKELNLCDNPRLLTLPNDIINMPSLKRMFLFDQRNILSALRLFSLTQIDLYGYHEELDTTTIDLQTAKRQIIDYPASHYPGRSYTSLTERQRQALDTLDCYGGSVMKMGESASRVLESFGTSTTKHFSGNFFRNDLCLFHNILEFEMSVLNSEVEAPQALEAYDRLRNYYLTGVDKSRLRLAKNLTMIPPEVTQYKSTDLPLQHGMLTMLPPEISLLKNIRMLTLHHNSLFILPHTIGGLRELHVLDVAHNQLTSLPPQLANCKKLWRIKADGNDIRTLPKVVIAMESLTSLSIFEPLDKDDKQLKKIRDFTAKQNRKNPELNYVDIWELYPRLEA